MPLTIAQKDFIEAAIEHLLDFSTEVNELKKQALRLREALQQDVPESHEFHQLRKCIISPTRHLQGLERYGATETTQAATILDVQNHLIALCIQKINGSARASNISLSALGVDHLEALPPSDQPMSLFKSESAPTQTHYMPWEFIHEIGQIGYSTLIVAENLRHIDLKIRLWLPNETQCFTINHITDLPPNTDMTQFLIGIIPEVLDATLVFTKKYILQRFKFDWIKDSLIQQAYADEPFNHIINNEYYIQLLLSNSVDIQLLLNLSRTDMHKLLDPITISLLKINFCTIAQAKQLTKEQIHVASCYTSLIQNCKLNFKELANLSTSQCKLMAHPAITNLIKQNKLSFHDAQQLPSNFLKVLSINFYLEYFTRHEIPWTIFIKMSALQGERLLHPKIVKLTSENIFNVIDVMQMLPKFFDLITHDRIFDLLLAKKITRHDLNTIPFDTLINIIDCEELYHCINASILIAAELNTSRLITLIESGFSRRLHGIYAQTPYTIRGQKDELNQFMQDLSNFTVRAHLQLHQVKENITTNFMTTISNDIQKLVPTSMLSREKKSFRYLLLCQDNLFMFASAQVALNQLSQLAIHILDDIQQKHHLHHRFGFFKAKQRDKQTQVRMICENILSVAAFVSPLSLSTTETLQQQLNRIPKLN